MNKVLRYVIAIASFCFHITFLFGQNIDHYSRDIEMQIKKVENNLTNPIQIENYPVNRWNLKERMRFYHANGISITVIKDYKIAWTKNYGWADSSEMRPVTSKTRFQAASNSKSLNAIGILKLVQEGKINLTDDINKYLINWKFPYDSLANGKKITIANLLSHTAGLSVHGYGGYEKGDIIPTIIQILNGLSPANSEAVRSVFEPSTRFQYSGGGSVISQLIIEDVTGLPYNVYMWENVLKPLGMTNSSYIQPPSNKIKGLLATGYYNDGTSVKGKYHIYPEQAAAGLWTTSIDMAKYVIETQLALLGKSHKVLNQKMTIQRLTPYIDSLSALGVFIMNMSGVKYFKHGGVNEGFVSQYVGSFQGGNGAVIMTNASNTGLLEEIIYSIASVYQWKNYAPETRKTISPSDSLIQAYNGKYEIDGYVVSILKKSDGLYFEDLQRKVLRKIYFIDDTHFFVMENNLKFSFEVDNSNQVVGLNWNKQFILKKIE